MSQTAPGSRSEDRGGEETIENGMIWRLQSYELDDVRFELRYDGQRVAIAPLPLRLLIYLARKRPVSVARAELLRDLWRGARVTDASLARAVLAARRAVRSGAGGEGVIRTVRGRGYAIGDAWQSDGPLCSDRGAGAAPLIGRAQELAQFEAALDGVEAGGGRLLFLSGEPGIGKSRLLAELSSRAIVRGTRVVTGQCREGEDVPPYWPWPGMLHGLAGGLDVVQIAAGRALLAEATPRMERSGEALPQTDPHARFRLLYAVAQFLRRAAEQRAVVVVLEDLHWAGQGALQLLRFVGRSLADARLLIAATYRTVDAPVNPLVEATVGELSALPHAGPELRLSGLSNAEVATYVRRVAGQTPTEELARHLQKASGGNPLFLRELVHAEGSAGETGSLRIPPGIDRVLRARVGRLSIPARELVEVAALLGNSFAPRLLARAMRRSLDVVLEGLGEVRAQGLVIETREGWFRFRHDIARSVLREALRPARRTELDRRLAALVEKPVWEPGPLELAQSSR